MQSVKFSLLSPRARWAGALFGFVASLATLSAVFVVFASASGELEPLVAKSKPAAGASAVASQAPVKHLHG